MIDQGVFVGDYPRTLTIDVSADGGTWEPVWKGDTGLHAYFGALRHPKEVPLVLSLNRDNVRFIRLRQVGFGPRDWSIAELHVRR